MSATRSRLTTLSAFLSVALIAASAACVPTGPTVDEYRAKSPTLAKADRERVLRIGVQDQLPLMSEHDQATDKWTGFEVQIATLLAHQLGFTRPESYQFIRLTTEKRISALQSGEVHLVVADFTVTDERRKLVRFAGPYFLTTPEIMIRRTDQDKIKTIDQLKQVKVCTTGGSTSAEVLTKYGVPHSLLAKGAECAEGVRNGTYDAHCTDDVAIAGRVHRFPEFAKVDMPFSDTEPLGVGLPLDDPYLEGLVAHYLKKQLDLGDRSQWQAAYDANLQVVLGPKQQPPLFPGYPVLRDHDDDQRR
ncbi:transporter substrate-binding domain-containing protein [Allorhizocola rhizosphaerae]|uniref:transporter substrate-binding domain-containing protein n=1 Tax=Allorhizocola rhizosphaerae TaxID=1872709 RepID=UPI000E3C2D3B|nr:transporter substrate-binding domain-containing protein [Allorhizocola rhizosphaerae]